MPDILIRNVSQEVADALDSKAKATGAASRGEWLAKQLEKMSVLPETYAYRVRGCAGSGAIRRYSNHLNGTTSTFSNFNQHEADAMERAESFIRRNTPGDKERAFDILVAQFGYDNVFEIPV